MEPENYTKENKNTLTNILLFLVLLVMVGILFFLVKNSKKTEISYTPDEEVLVNIPVEVEPNPAPVVLPVVNPNPTPTPQNINLVVGQQYPTSFSRDTQHNYSMTYCGIENRLALDGVNRNYMAFYSGSCEGDVFNSKAESLTDFLVGVDDESKITELEELNNIYNVSIVSSLGNPVRMYVLRVNGNINAYSMSKIYFDSGNFTFAEPDALIIGQGN